MNKFGSSDRMYLVGIFRMQKLTKINPSSSVDDGISLGGGEIITEKEKASQM